MISSEVIECPKCSKHTLVQRTSDLYQCLSCDFERDFSQFRDEEEREEENSENGILFFLLIVFTLFALL